LPVRITIGCGHLSARRATPTQLGQLRLGREGGEFKAGEARLPRRVVTEEAVGDLNSQGPPAECWQSAQNEQYRCTRRVNAAQQRVCIGVCQGMYRSNEKGKAMSEQKRTQERDQRGGQPERSSEEPVESGPLEDQPSPQEANPDADRMAREQSQGETARQQR
jgi:hypothetical protein